MIARSSGSQDFWLVVSRRAATSWRLAPKGTLNPRSADQDRMYSANDHAKQLHGLQSQKTGAPASLSARNTGAKIGID
jgi:hypothetical protein